MIKVTYSNGFNFKYYPFISELFYTYLLKGGNNGNNKNRSI
jgi:hypothetical protein